MKILQLLALCACIFVFIGCTNYGKKYSPDKTHEVYYKGDGVDEATASKLFDFLKANSYFVADHGATVQINKVKDTFHLSFVYDEKMVDADREAKFMSFGGQIDRNVFGGAPMTIKLCDENMKMFKNIGYVRPSGE